jgi:hypothetical protein
MVVPMVSMTMSSSSRRPEMPSLPLEHFSVFQFSEGRSTLSTTTVSTSLFWGSSFNPICS